MNHLRHQNYKNKILNYTRKNRALKVKNSFLELEIFLNQLTYL